MDSKEQLIDRTLGWSALFSFFKTNKNQVCSIPVFQFYHACDGMRIMKYRLCITHYDVLQLADFFGSACSLWFTVVAMACIKQKHATGLLQIVGSFCLFVAVVYDRTHFALIASPIFSGLVIIGISWGLRMYRTKQLYPSWRRYVFFLVPGVMMAILAGACFTMFETKRNYKYLHSLWHTCIATSIVLLLPPKAVRADKIYGANEALIEMPQLSRISYSQNIS
ncbi:hypothetical protein EGW08_019644 [Elysia chlorotica]|uniref:Transmembrane protein 8B n=1 Tax=Elysia chlorotica TaxID=188477 RepID=A0A433STK6_ELYCH|nr:hypothetical protein EGW08_019644 [Elysia chlorotica]